MNWWNYKLARALLFPIMKLIGRAEVIGSENVPSAGGVLICANHVSYIDPPTLGWASPRPVRFMAKQELFDIPLLGPLIRSYNAFPVHRGTADRTALKTAIESLQAGNAVAMFPEGKRSMDGKLQEAEPGVGMIVMRSNAVVVPCALINTERFLPPHSWLLRFARIRVVFGEPIEYSDLREKGGRESLDLVSKRIMSAIGDLLEQYRDHPGK